MICSKKKYLSIFLFCSILSLLFFGCQSTKNLDIQFENDFLTTENKELLENRFSEALHKEISLSNHFQPSKNTFYMRFLGEKLTFHLVAVKMEQSLDFSVLPERVSAKQFIQANNPTITINGSPYNMKTLEPVGIVIQNQKLYSNPVPTYSAFSIDINNVPKIYEIQSDIKIEDTKVALGGFFTIIKDGKKYGTYQNLQDSRTAIGISKEKDYIFLLLVEGEFYTRSDGLSFEECADLLLAISVENALQMDGGGSTTLYITNKNALSYKTLRKNAIYFAIIDEP